VALGLTDTDDANTAVVSGKPVALVYPDEQGMGTPCHGYNNLVAITYSSDLVVADKTGKTPDGGT